ncbi:MAG: hypothetical protein M3Y48_21260 [Actinomycetota bacterium]|nr:hypothetical protein [Actinomycetota bacterium]
MTDSLKKILLFLIEWVGISWFEKIYIKPISARYPMTDVIILLLVVLVAVVAFTVQTRRKLKSLEPEQRNNYLKRNGILVAFAVLLMGFASWQMFR